MGKSVTGLTSNYPKTSRAPTGMLLAYVLVNDAFQLVLQVYWIMELACWMQSIVIPVQFLTSAGSGIVSCRFQASGALSLVYRELCLYSRYYWHCLAFFNEEANKPANSIQPYMLVATL